MFTINAVEKRFSELYLVSALQTPRTEAVSILGALLCLPNTFAGTLVLQPSAGEFTLMPCSDAKVGRVYSLSFSLELLMNFEIYCGLMAESWNSVTR
jgi:hypothetical protein